jgi:hypothetical protein
LQSIQPLTGHRFHRPQNKAGQNPNRYQDIVSALVDRTMVAVVDLVLGSEQRGDEDVVCCDSDDD